MNKQTLCVVFGGKSPEHDISRRSVTSVLENLDKSKYDILMLGITKAGEWYLFDGDVSKIIDGSWETDTIHIRRAIISPDTSDHGILVLDKDKFSLIKIDVIFPVLHGEHGEDGTIQGLFEIAGIAYVGMGVVGSANGMDKSYTKIVMQDAGIPQADWIVVTHDDLSDMTKIVQNVEKKFGFPCFIKPAGTGSSVGVGRASNKDELEASLRNAAIFGDKILIEENIDGHEVECAVLGNNNPKASVVGEILPTAEFYDFDAKYVSNTTKLQIPANLDDDTSQKIREYAIRAFTALDGKGLSRVDFFVKHKDGSVVLNEINTMPGFTDISMYPKLWGACGTEYTKLLDKLIELAIEHKNDVERIRTHG